jgi:hypothetical protein
MEQADSAETPSQQPCLERDAASVDDDASTARPPQAVQSKDDDDGGALHANPTSVTESSSGPDLTLELDEKSPDRLVEEVRAATTTSTNPNEPTPPSRSPSSRTKSLSPAPESWSTAAGPPLSSAALAALAESLPSPPPPPPPPVRPPKSAARPRTSSVPSSSGAEAAAIGSGDSAANRDQPAEPDLKPGSPVMVSSATTTTTTPTLSGSGGGALSQSRPRPPLSTTTTTTTARISTASSSAGSSPYPSRRSGAFYTDESDWTGGGGGGGGGPSSSSIAALETPATTVNFGASPSSSPAAAVDSSRHQPRPLDVETPPSAELAGLGLDFLATKPALPSLDPEAAAARTSFDYDDLDRGVERISQFAKTLPSPVPTVPAQSHFGPPAAVGGLPKMTMTTMSGGASEPSSPAMSTAERPLPLPRLGMSTSPDSFTSPAPSLHGRLAAFESETDFFSTDVQTDADADGDGDGDGDYDERDDSFNLYPHGLDGGRRRRRRERSASSSWGDPPPSLRFQGPSPHLELDSFALLAGGKQNGGGGQSTGLWNEDVPNWEGALPRPGDGVVDWTECRLQRQALPSSESWSFVFVHFASLKLTAPLLYRHHPSDPRAVSDTVTDRPALDEFDLVSLTNARRPRHWVRSSRPYSSCPRI